MIGLFLGIIPTFILICAMLKFGETLINKKLKLNLKMVLTIIIYTIIYTVTFNYLPQELTSIISILCLIVAFKVIFKLPLEKLIYYVLIVWLFGIFFDVLLMIVLSCLSILDFDKNFLFGIKSIATLIMALMYFFVTKNKFVVRKINSIYKKTLKINYPIIKIIFTFIMIFTVDAICVNFMEFQYIPILLLISLIVFITTSVNIIVQNYQILSLKETNSILSRSISFYIEKINEYRILKHNIKNKLLGLKSITELNVHPYINAMIEEYNEKTTNFKEIMNVPNELNYLILQKINEYDCNSLQIQVDNKLKKDILNILSPRNYNLLCEALGITLDNALDAAIKSKEKNLYLSFLETQNNIKIVIANSFLGTIDIDKVGTINYTSKQNGHGLGLVSLFLKNNLIIKNKIKGNLFITQMLISKLKK